MAEPSPPDLNLLRVLAVLLQERNTTKAAARLGTSQSSVSASLARLRTLFGDPLFLRRPRGLEPTARALGIEGELRAWVDQAGVFTRPATFDARTARREFAIVATDYARTVLLPRVLARMQAEGPGLRLSVLPRTVPDDSLDSGRADLLLTPRDRTASGHRHCELFHERFVVAMRRDHSLAAAPLTLDLFCAARHLLVAPTPGAFEGAADAALQALGRRREVAVSTYGLQGALEMLRRSDLICVLSERLLHRQADIAMRPAPLNVPGWTLSAFWPATKHDDAGHVWLRNLVTSVATDI